MKGSVKKSLSILLMFAMVLSLLPSMTITASAASGADYQGVTYSAKARVDESVGLRGTVTISSGGASATGIKGADTQKTASIDVGSGTMDVTAAANEHYTFVKTVVVAMAQITHPDGSIDAAKDVQENTGASYTYTVPDFSEFVKSGDKLDVEVSVYADFTYNAPQSTVVINLANGSITPATAGISLSGTIFTINAEQLPANTVIELTGDTIATANGKAYMFKVTGSKTQRNSVHMILNNATILRTPGTTKENYRSYVKSSLVYECGFADAAATNAGNMRVSTTTTRKTVSPINLSDVDVYITLKGENILSINNAGMDSGMMCGSGIMVDASSSIVVTDASSGSLFAQSGGCSAAIGSAAEYPSGYVEIDGGKVEAISAWNDHSFAGIGNGGHYENRGGGNAAKDPGGRGIVINGGEVTAFGTHYGLGCEGGSGEVNGVIWPSYVVITGGKVISEASSMSGGAAIGCAQCNGVENAADINSTVNEVRIGRPDTAGPEVKAVNWGFGAAISGKMTFHSGNTKAYSGEYAAAIGGNAVSMGQANKTWSWYEAEAKKGSSSKVGADLLVYGGKIEAVSGAFTNMPSQKGGGYFEGLVDARGFAGNRTSVDSIDPNTEWTTKGYGAGIGGAAGKRGGFSIKIFAGDFNVISSKYGAGIGGGGGMATLADKSGGAGGDSWIGSLMNNNTKAVENISFGINSGIVGAGIGGGGSADANGGSGGNLYISTKTDPDKVATSTKEGEYVFTITSGQFGAGVGGGGSMTGSGGSGADKLVINGGNFKILAGGTQLVGAYDTNAYGQYSYGAGIGGGGSFTSNAGNGPSRADIKGGYFDVISGGYGSSIGGGGSDTGAGGGCGLIYVTSGTIKAMHSPAAVDLAVTKGLKGLGGGASRAGATNVADGTVIIIGGNVYTTAGTAINGANPRQHVWTRPNNAKKPTGVEGTSYVGEGWDGTLPTISSPGNQDMYLENTTEEYLEIKDIAPERIGQCIDEVAYSFPDSSRVTGTYYDYGVKDTYVTKGENGSGAVAVWVPSGYLLKYDLTSGSANAATGYTVQDSTEYAFGSVALRFSTADHDGKTNYMAKGQEKTLIQQGDIMSQANTFFDGMYAGKNYADGVNKYRQLLSHPDVPKAATCTNDKIPAGANVPVAFVGWSAAPDSKIYDVHENIFPTLIQKVAFEQSDITVYAVWGYDENGNGIADILEGNWKLKYDANGGTGAPAIASEGRSGDNIPINSQKPTHANLPDGTPTLFVGWSDQQLLDVITQNNSTRQDVAVILGDLYISGGSQTFGDKTVTGKAAYTMPDDNVTLYAVWASDSNQNGIPDYLEDMYSVIYNNVAAEVTGAPPLPVDANKYVTGNTVQLDTTYNGTGTANGIPVVFLYWTADSGKAGTVYTYGAQAGGLLPDKLTAAVIANADYPVYAVWSTDENGNGTPDAYEDGYSVTYEDPAALAPMPEPQVNLHEGDVVTLDDGSGIKVEGWHLAGWTLDRKLAGKYDDQNLWNTNFTSSGTGITTPPYYDKNIEKTVTMAKAPITVYAVWFVDKNENGVPDWLDDGGYKVFYNPSKDALATLGGNLDPASMPFDTNSSGNPEGTTIDDNGGKGYLVNENVELDLAKKPVDLNNKFMFIGWSPAYWHTTVYGNTASDREQFEKHVKFITDIKNGTDTSGLNWYGTSGQPSFGPYVSEAQSGRKFYDLIGGTIDWNNYKVGDGFIKSVVEPSVDFTNNTATEPKNPTDPPYVKTSWAVYAVWAADTNHNQIPDMYESSFTLYYNGNGADGNIPYNKTGNMPGDTVVAVNGRIDQSVTPPEVRTIYRYDTVNNNNMIFLGWTTDSTVASKYDAGQQALLPKIVSAVTFGEFDITLYAVWATDANLNEIPDVYEGNYRLIYDANGGTGGPIDNKTYHYDDKVHLDLSQNPTNGAHLFLYWTVDENVMDVYKRGDRSKLPVKTDEVIFKDRNITVYAVWGADENGDGVPDVYEDAYHLSYNANGGTGAPVDNNDYVHMQTVTLDGGAGMTNGKNLFVGWTLSEISDYNSVYTFGEKDLLPKIVSAVTFETKDITANAVWSTDINENGIYDVYEDAYVLSYDLNGGTDSTGAFGSVKLLPGQKITVPGVTPAAPASKTFTGWLADGVMYSPNSTFTMPAKDVVLVAQWKSEGGGGSGGGGGGGGGGAPTEYTLTFETNGGSKIDSVKASSGTTINLNSYIPTKAEYVFEGWYTDSKLTDKVKSVKMDGNKTVYAKWVTKAVNPDGTPGELNSKDHIKYIEGYPDGTVRVNNNITRSEVATVFYRLLTAERRDNIFTSSNSFSDVSGDLWYNKAVSSMANGKYVTGYADGTFGGDNPITRAEFVTIAARFMNTATTTANFSDVTEAHWAYPNIATATASGWLTGYPDGTFKPDRAITRGEAITIINRMLNRGISASDIPAGVAVFSDLRNSEWCYTDVVEATNNHEYKGARPAEKWSSLQLTHKYDITKYERP